MRDIVFKAIQSQENALDREQRIASAIFQANSAASLQDQKLDAAADANLLTNLAKGVGGFLNFAGTESGGSALSAVGDVFRTGGALSFLNPF